MAEPEYRSMLFPLDGDRLAPFRGLDAATFGRTVQGMPFAGDMVNAWNERMREPFHGITCNGSIESGLFEIGRDEGAPVAAAAAAARSLLERLPAADRERLRYPIDAEEWRKWSNPEFLVNPPIPITAPRSITVKATQIQYSQHVFLNFDGITWPHISVATLVPSGPIAIPPAAWA